MIGTPASSNFLAHTGSEAMKTGSALTKATLGVDRALGVELVGLLRAHRQVGDEHVGLGVLEHLDDVDRLGVGLLDGLAVVLAEAVEGVAALHARCRVGGTSQILMVLFSEALMASERSLPTFLSSTSNAATNSTSLTW